MANLSITASQVSAGSGASETSAIASVAITAGQAVYLTATGQLALADANVSAVEAAAAGIATSTASGAGQRVFYVTEGPVTLGAGAAPAAGQPYVVSATAGAICPDADITSTQYYRPLCTGIGNNQVFVSIPSFTPVVHA